MDYIWITLLVLFLLIALMVVVIMIYKILKRKEHEAEINKKLLALQKKTDEAKIEYTQKEYEFQQYNEKKEQDELMLRFLMIMYFLELLLFYGLIYLRLCCY